MHVKAGPLVVVVVVVMVGGFRLAAALTMSANTTWGFAPAVAATQTSCAARSSSTAFGVIVRRRPRSRVARARRTRARGARGQRMPSRILQLYFEVLNLAPGWIEELM